MKPFASWVSDMANKYEDGSAIKPKVNYDSRTSLQIRYDFAMLECGEPKYSSSVVAWLSAFSGRKSTEDILGLTEDNKWFDAEDNIEYWLQLKDKILSGWLPDDLPDEE